MELAGEAGSLLTIEEEIRTRHRRGASPALGRQSVPKQARLVPRSSRRRRSRCDFDLLRASRRTILGGGRAADLRRARAYAEQAENGGGFQRRLFADDAAQGFAFIDLCRKRYDVVVMNPPFGEFSSKWKKRAVEVYPNTRNDIFAAFTERMLEVMVPDGAVGAITSRTGLFITSLELWRRTVILGGARLRCLADLGDGVMDNAMVEAAAYCFDKAAPDKRALFIRIFSLAIVNSGFLMPFLN